MQTALIEIRACLASLGRMIERARLLSEEYDRRVRKASNGGPPADALEHAISFPEVRSVDLLCKDTIERTLPDYPDLASTWHVHGDIGAGSPEDLLSDLLQKKVVLQHALDLVTARSSVVVGSEFFPVGLRREYQKLADSVQLFFQDTRSHCQDYDHNVFIMTRFQRNDATLEMFDNAIRTTLRSHGLVGHRADDRCYPTDRNLWDNVCTYMMCCKYGIAVLEDIIVDEFNPNVALEDGFMRALGKPTLLLNEAPFQTSS